MKTRARGARSSARLPLRDEGRRERSIDPPATTLCTDICPAGCAHTDTMLLLLQSRLLARGYYPVLGYKRENEEKKGRLMTIVKLREAIGRLLLCVG